MGRKIQVQETVNSSFAVYECMGRKIQVQETVNKDFNFAKQFFTLQSKWRPWYVPCLPFRYATEINVTQSSTVKVSLVMSF